MNAEIFLASTQVQIAVAWPKSGNWPLLAGGLAAVAFLVWTSRQRPVAGRADSKQKPWPILYGADGRRSTSKLTAFSWTAALLFGGVTLCVAALSNKLPLSDIGLDTLPEQYLVLLAVPYGSLVAAKLITQSKVESQSIVKAPPAPAGTETKSGPHAEGGFTAGDRGERSLQDVQYLTFNALLLVYFVTALWITHALPELPDWLVGLSGVSAATYVAAKAVESEPPEITAITQYPKVVAGANGYVLQVRGKHLHQPVHGKTVWGVGVPVTKTEGAQFMELKECVTVANHEVLDVEFLGEHGFDVTLRDMRAANETLTVTLLGGIVLKDPQ